MSTISNGGNITMNYAKYVWPLDFVDEDEMTDAQLQRLKQWSLGPVAHTIDLYADEVTEDLGLEATNVVVTNRNNDDRETCYHCNGELVEKEMLGPGQKYKVCVDCGR